MLIKRIHIPHCWESIGSENDINLLHCWESIDSENDNIDVFVKTDDGFNYNLVVGTATNIEYLMDKEQMNYFELGYPFIIVKKLTKEILEETMKAYAEERGGYWLKFYRFSMDIEERVFDQLKAEDGDDPKKFNELVVKKIFIQSRWEDLNVENDHIEVFVELDDGYTCSVVVGTAKNIEFLMDQANMNYFKPGRPFILVKQLTEEIVEEAIQAYAKEDNGYSLKLYHFAEKIDESVFNSLKLKEEHSEEVKEFDETDFIEIKKEETN